MKYTEIINASSAANSTGIDYSAGQYQLCSRLYTYVVG